VNDHWHELFLLALETPEEFRGGHLGPFAARALMTGLETAFDARRRGDGVVPVTAAGFLLGNTPENR
jgi:hypothetical protein